MRKTIFAICIICAALAGCSGDNPIETVTPDEEMISTPDDPAGMDMVTSDEDVVYRTSAASNLDHPIEYRFDFDAAGPHSYTDWSAADSASASWQGAGTRVVKAQARCATHKSGFKWIAIACSLPVIRPGQWRHGTLGWRIPTCSRA